MPGQRAVLVANDLKKTFVGGEKEYVYTISNIKGHENGTTDLEHSV